MDLLRRAGGVPEAYIGEPAGEKIVGAADPTDRRNGRGAEFVGVNENAVDVNPPESAVKRGSNMVPFSQGQDIGRGGGREPVGAIAEAVLQGGLLVNVEARGPELVSRP